MNPPSQCGTVRGSPLPPPITDHLWLPKRTLMVAGIGNLVSKSTLCPSWTGSVLVVYNLLNGSRAVNHVGLYNSNLDEDIYKLI